MDTLNSPSFKDFWWDNGDHNNRDSVVLNEQIIPLLVYSKSKIPFYKEHYKIFSNYDIQNITSIEEYADVIPPITKEHIATNHPYSFMPDMDDLEVDRTRGKFWRFGTGGTTSKPVLIIHSMSDWRAKILHANRHIEYDFYKDPNPPSGFDFDRSGIIEDEHKCLNTPLNSAIIFGAYNADHVTNNIYSAMLTALGSDFFWRASTKATVEDNYELMKAFQVNGVLAPPEDPGSRQTKGTTLDEFLRIDARRQGPWRLNHRHNPDFKFVFWSSMPISEELMRHLKEDRKIPYIKGHFGSTEVCPTASTCSRHPRKFHLGYGPSLVFVKRLDLKGLAKPDELGFLVVSKIGATAANGKNTFPSGMVFLNYLTGDGARLSENGKVCECGRNTPLIYDMQRISFHRGKAVHGCQVD